MPAAIVARLKRTAFRTWMSCGLAGYSIDPARVRPAALPMSTGRAPSQGMDGALCVTSPIESRLEGPQRQLQAFDRLI